MNDIPKIRKIFAVTVLAGSLWIGSLPVCATTISEVQQQISQTQNEIDEIGERIDAYSEEQEILMEEIDDLNSEVINILTSIGLKEEEIAETQAEIEETEAAYYAAQQRQQDQENAMTLQIQLMYEKGDSSMFAMLLQSSSLADLLNRAYYARKVNAYNDEMLDRYIQVKNEVHDLWELLEEQKERLEGEKEELESQKAYCETVMAQLRQKVENYDILIARANQEAAAAKAKLAQEKKELKKLQEAERKRREEEARKAALAAAAAAAANAANAGGTSGGVSTSSADANSVISSASGSEKGKQIASYACQFVGNPYVAGGTSLTNGADCSGFTYRVYADWGYTLPRTSFEQRSVGTGVSYSEAQPGDLICYSGHVAMYIGSGKIVHASTAKTGIKIGNAQYREILAVRRIVN